MDHVAIMKKSWEFIPKILTGEKTIESRWYKTKRAPWGKITKGETVYFKNSGEPVTVAAKVSQVEEFEIDNNKSGLTLMKRYAQPVLGTTIISRKVINYITNKRYVVFIHLGKVRSVKPFEINKKGFGAQAAWIITPKIGEIAKENI